ncbi:MAG: rhomboid family intramembrane serine protease [Pirellulales bacterium]|nr:rhomboid family intramembrane serine protease [Pirellulales bacterium]
MGIYDREYSRDSEPGVQLGLPYSITVRLALVTGAAYLVQIFGTERFTETFALWNDWYREPWRAYQLLTYGFLHAPHDIAHILINMLVLVMFGRELESRYGRAEFLRFYLTALVVAGLVWTGWEIATGHAAAPRVNPGSPNGIVFGASGAVTALVALFAANYPRRTVLLNFFIPVPMWLAGLLMVLSDLAGASGRFGPSNVAYSAHLGGAAFGLLYFYTQWLPLRSLEGLTSRLPKAPRPTLRVHEPEEGDDLQSQVDRILEKIQNEGQDSLTRRERAILEQASRRYREQRGG